MTTGRLARPVSFGGSRPSTADFVTARCSRVSFSALCRQNRRPTVRWDEKSATTSNAACNDRHDDELARRSYGCSEYEAVPRFQQLAIRCVRIEQPDEIAKHAPVLVLDTRTRQDHRSKSMEEYRDQNCYDRAARRCRFKGLVREPHHDVPPVGHTTGAPVSHASHLRRLSGQAMRFVGQVRVSDRRGQIGTA